MYTVWYEYVYTDSMSLEYYDKCIGWCYGIAFLLILIIALNDLHYVINKYSVHQLGIRDCWYLILKYYS